MDRRSFLNFGAIALLSGGFATSLARKKAFATSGIIDESFLIETVTDKPNLTAKLISEVLTRRFKMPSSFSQSVLIGQYKADIACVLDNKLLNFYQSDMSLADDLRKVVKKLRFPRNIENPILLSFRSATYYPKSKYANVFVNNELKKKINLNENISSERVKTNKGELYLRVENGKAKAVESSCKYKTCVKQGEIEHCGDNIICIPNGVRISISAE